MHFCEILMVQDSLTIIHMGRIRQIVNLLRVTGSFVFISGSGWVVYQIYRTKYVLSHTVKTDVIEKKRKADYIYINDPQFHIMYEKTRLCEEERRLKAKASWFPSLTGFFKSLRRSYSWQLVAMARSEDRNDRIKAVQLLAKLKNLKDWDYRNVAQMCDAQTAVGLARTEGTDARFFLKPPYSHLSLNEQELTDKMCNLLISLHDLKQHQCIKYFLAKAFPELQYRHIVFDTDLATMELPQTPIRKDDILPLSIANLLHHSSIDDNAIDIVRLGGLPLINYLIEYFDDNIDVTITLINILSNISAHEGMLKPFHTAGCIGLLCKWSRHPNIRMSAPATRALANLDLDDSSDAKFKSHLHLLHPTMRRIDLPKLDVVFIHGLLGGVFITWRQRDSEHTSLSLLEGSSNCDDGRYFGRCISDERTKDYLDNMAEFKQNEWEALGSDYEVVLSDCPENANCEGKGPYSYSGCHPCVRPSNSGCKPYTVCWPRDWLADDCHFLRVIGVNYDTKLSMWAPMCPVEAVKRTLEYRSKELMNKLKQAGLGTRPIVWVAHSMGGLLVKSMLTRACFDEDEQVRKLCNNTKAIVFYSVPHRGSPLVALTQATQLLLWPSVEVQELRENSPALLDLHSKFLKLVEKKDIEVISFAETKPTLLSSLHLQFRFVPTESANPGVGEFFEIPQDHLCICKPCGRHSFLYQKLLHLISKYIVVDE